MPVLGQPGAFGDLYLCVKAKIKFETWELLQPQHAARCKDSCAHYNAAKNEDSYKLAKLKRRPNLVVCYKSSV